MSSFSIDPLVIHQFSSGIINPQQNKKGQWVSGGYDKEIAKVSSNHVPDKIKEAVNTFSKGGWRGFGIPDACPPQEGEFALIARELENYCVLAVANQQKDETNRSFIAYRYFWLDKQELKNKNYFHDFDGIATLLDYWKNKGNPQYDIKEWANNSGLYTSWYSLKQYKIKRDLVPQNFKRIENLILDINNPSNQYLNHNEPLIYEANAIGGSLKPEEVHCLAFQYSDVKKCSINWAWNVRRLENMKDLRVIYCADDEALNCFHQELSKRRQRRYSHRPNESGGEPPNVPGSHGDPTEQAQKTKDIKKIIQKFRGRFEKENVLTLTSYYQAHKQDIVRFEDKYIQTQPI